MRGIEDKARFNTMLVWLSKRMKDHGGLPKKIDADLQDDYFFALSDIRIERLEWSAKKIFATKTWFPMPQELREQAMLAPSDVLPTVNLNQKSLPEATYTESVAEDAFKSLMALFGDGWGLPTTRR